jgi:hypothetical protein
LLEENKEEKETASPLHGTIKAAKEKLFPFFEFFEQYLSWRNKKT